MSEHRSLGQDEISIKELSEKARFLFGEARSALLEVGNLNEVLLDWYMGEESVREMKRTRFASFGHGEFNYVMEITDGLLSRNLLITRLTPESDITQDIISVYGWIDEIRIEVHKGGSESDGYGRDAFEYYDCPGGVRNFTYTNSNEAEEKVREFLARMKGDTEEE